MIDHEATRAAARALYEGQSRYHFTDLSDAALTAMIRDAHERGPDRIVGETRRKGGNEQVRGFSVDALTSPLNPLNRGDSGGSPHLDAGQIETVLRSVPQICANCRLHSDAEATPCPSPRGHWFVTDYTAMAEKLRERLR